MIKPGCMFKSALIAVTIIGISYYLFDHYGAAIYKRSKDRIIEKLSTEITEKLKKEAENQLAADLNRRISDLSDELKSKLENVDLTEVDKLFGEVNSIIDTSVIDQITYDKISGLIEKYEK